MSEKIESSEEVKALQKKIENLEWQVEKAIVNTYRNILPIFDDLNRAKDNIDSVKDLDSLKEGLKLVSHKLTRSLQSLGLDEIRVKEGDTFNVDKHDAIVGVDTDRMVEDGKIISVSTKGYMYYDEIIRFPKVVVGTHKPK